MIGLVCDEQCPCEPPPPPPPCDTVLTVYAYKCPGVTGDPFANPADGATAELIVGGSVVATATFSGGSPVVFTYATAVVPTEATVRIPAWCGFREWTASVTLRCQPTWRSAFLLADDDHHCCRPCGDPIPRVGYLTTDNGTFTLSLAGGVGDPPSSTCVYQGTASFTSRAVDPQGETFTCACGPPTGTLTQCKFTYNTAVVSFPVTVTVDPTGLTGPAGVRCAITWGVWVGPTGCSSCEWAYAVAYDPSGPQPCALLFAAGINPWTGSLNQSVDGTPTCSACGDVAASGSFPASVALGYPWMNCDSYTAPTPEPFPCGVTVPHPIGEWTFAT